MRKISDIDTGIFWQTAARVMLVTLVAEYCLLTCGFIVGVTAGWWQFPVALLLALLGVTPRSRTGLWGAVTAILLTELAIAFCAWLPDVSYDGNAYHKDAMAWLMQGWNPLRDPAPDASVWVLHYPAGAELTGAGISLMTGILEAGKSSCAILFISAICALRDALQQLLPGVRAGWKWLVVIAAALNPVALFQIPSFYIDYSIYSVVIWATLLAMGSLGRHSAANRVLLCAVTILAIGIKWSTAFFVGFVWFAVILWLLLGRRARAAGQFCLFGLLALALGTLLFGYHPYVTNTLQAGHPLYPLMGQGAYDIITGLTPETFQGHGRLYGLTVSHLMPHIGMLSPDTRAGGFGPAMGPLLLLSLTALIANFRRISRAELYIYVMILLSCLVFEPAWWARYIPQLWLLMPVSMIALLRSAPRSRLNRTAIVAMAVLSLTVLPIWAYGMYKGPIAFRKALTEYARNNRGRTVRGYRIVEEGDKAPAAALSLAELGVTLQDSAPDSLRTEYLFAPSSRAEENFYVVELDDTTLKYILSLSEKFPILENSLTLKEKFCRDAQKYYFCR